MNEYIRRAKKIAIEAMAKILIVDDSIVEIKILKVSWLYRPSHYHARNGEEAEKNSKNDMRYDLS